MAQELIESLKQLSDTLGDDDNNLLFNVMEKLVHDAIENGKCIDDMRRRIDDVGGRIDDLEQHIDASDKCIDNNRARINYDRGLIGDLSMRLNNVNRCVNDNGKRVDGLWKRVERLERLYDQNQNDA